MFCVGLWMRACGALISTALNSSQRSCTVRFLTFVFVYELSGEGIYELAGMGSTQRHLGQARLCLHKQNHVGELLGSFRAGLLC